MKDATIGMPREWVDAKDLFDLPSRKQREHTDTILLLLDVVSRAFFRSFGPAEITKHFVTVKRPVDPLSLGGAEGVVFGGGRQGGQHPGGVPLRHWLDHEAVKTDHCDEMFERQLCKQVGSRIPCESVRGEKLPERRHGSAPLELIRPREEGGLGVDQEAVKGPLHILLQNQQSVLGVDAMHLRRCVEEGAQVFEGWGLQQDQALDLNGQRFQRRGGQTGPGGCACFCDVVGDTVSFRGLVGRILFRVLAGCGAAAGLPSESCRKRKGGA